VNVLRSRDTVRAIPTAFNPLYLLFNAVVVVSLDAVINIISLDDPLTQMGYANPGQNWLIQNRLPDPFPTLVGLVLAFPILIANGGGDSGSKRSRAPSPNRPNIDRFGNRKNSDHSSRPKFGRNWSERKWQVQLQITNYPKPTELWSKTDLIFSYSAGSGVEPSEWNKLCAYHTRDAGSEGDDSRRVRKRATRRVEGGGRKWRRTATRYSLSSVQFH
jgi:hypothetical protein